jgi:hypothetical protein
LSARLWDDRDNDLDPPFCRRALLMDANYGGIDHLQFAIMGLGDGIHEAVPNTCFAPSDKAIVAGGAWAVPLGQIAPWRTGSQHPEDAVQHAAVIHARHATGFVGEKRFDHASCGISQVISAHASHESDFAVT